MHKKKRGEGKHKWKEKLKYILRQGDEVHIVEYFFEKDDRVGVQHNAEAGNDGPFDVGGELLCWRPNK